MTMHSCLTIPSTRGMRIGSCYSRFRVLVVVHAYRESDAVIRLISARRATKAEQAGYDARWQE